VTRHAGRAEPTAGAGAEASPVSVARSASSRAVASRVARMPGPAELRAFAGQLLSPTRASAVRAACDGVVVAWTLRRRGVRGLMPSSNGVSPQPDPDRSRAVAAAVEAGLGLIPMVKTCLRRSLTLSRELRRVGVSGTVHVGVRIVAGTVEAHAWVQVGEAVVNDDPAEIATYTELAAGELERIVPSLR
jgi:Transglutaminase-like superfamily